jgi:hypothetical protein
MTARLLADLREENKMKSGGFNTVTDILKELEEN